MELHQPEEREEMKFRKKPVVIDAVQFTGHNSTDVEAWGIGLDNKYPCGVKNGGAILVIKTLAGTMEARAGDWIIRGVSGEYYPCKPDIFEKTYEAVK
jgi:selenocysteine lyase/cysteine desulfurase